MSTGKTKRWSHPFVSSFCAIFRKDRHTFTFFTMGKRPRNKDTQQSAAAKESVWKPVEVGLEKPGEKILDKNHYDDDEDNNNNNNTLSMAADLDVTTGEEMGMFYSLQVIEPSQYRVITGDDGTKLFQIVTADAESKNEVISDKNPAKKIASKECDEDSDKPTQTSKASETDAKVKEPPKKKQKKKSKETASSEKPDEDSALSEQETLSLQESWVIATGGVTLHQEICKGLARQQFYTPMPIQSATLPASILGRRNIVGAAPTGSGKTLSFLLPILQYLMEQKDETSTNDDEDAQEDLRKLQALILTPTRELAMQIHKECDKLVPRQIGTIVGGLALPKQARVLNKNKPPILVGTPGRLWELMSSKDYAHLNDLSQVRYLVIDEADRMVKQGSFPQLSSILDALQRANPMDDDDSDDEGELDLDSEMDQNRLLGLPGIRGEARVQMLTDDILKQIEAQRTGEKPAAKEVHDDEVDEDDDEVDSETEDISLPLAPPVQRLTFVYSATLTLPASDKYVSTKKHKKDRSGVEGAIAEILERAHAKGKTKVVDLSSGNKIDSSTPKKEVKAEKSKKKEPKERKQFQLPPGLILQQIKCTQKHKDSHLYAYLTTTDEGSAGPCLVFCNSIAGVRRVGTTLQTLGVDVRILHAKMQQRARIKAVESLNQFKRRVVVIATDVAARGLDLLKVGCVVHYDGARTVDTFVHRAGRTARGMGEGSSGYSVSLVASGEDKTHARIIEALQTRFEPVHLDSRLMAAAQERVNLASKIVAESEVEQRRQRSNQWYQDQAAATGLEIDDDMIEDAADGDIREQSRSREAKAAKTRLHALLSQPMVAQRYGKFLSTSMAVTSKRVAPLSDAATAVSHSFKANSKKRRKYR